MTRFTQGQVVTLISDKSIEGAVIGMMDGAGENRYKVFTNTIGVQIYYESQLEDKEINTVLEPAVAARFHASLTASLITNPSLSSLYSLNAARIDLIPHQFRPVLKFIRSDRPRLLIADGVGVGKTIEAGLILREIQARRNLDSVLIICPRPLVAESKWENEMKRFDEEFVAIGGAVFRNCLKETDYEGEWPDKYKKVIIPYSLFDEINVIFNTYGDINQLLKDGRGIDNWDLLIGYLGGKKFELNENYRNTNQITRFCNEYFNMNIKLTGVDGKKVREITRGELKEELSNLNPENDRIVVLLPKAVKKDKYIDSDKLPAQNVIGDRIDEGRIAVLYVEEIKGIEFDIVYVVKNQMKENEKYIAYTRALSELVIVNDESIASAGTNI